MAKKPTATKSPKRSGGKSKAQTKQPVTRAENVSLSVTDGAMKDVIRTAFLRRNT